MVLILFLLGEASVSGATQSSMWLHVPEWKTQFYSQSIADLDIDNFRIGGRFLLDAENIRDTLTSLKISQRYLSYQSDEVSLCLGNYYAILGEGLALAAFEDKGVKCDRNIDGANLVWSNSFLNLGFYAGRMLNKDHITRSDWMYATEIMFTPIDALNIGAVYLRRDATQNADTLFGMAWENWMEENFTLRIWDLDIKGAVAQRFTWGRKTSTGWIGVENIKGFGLTASVSYAQPGFGLLLQGKSYKGLAGAINAPATCNLDGESINEGNDEQGFLIKTNLSPFDWIFADLSYSRAWNSDTAQPSIVGRTGTDIILNAGNHTFNPFFIWVDRELPAASGEDTQAPQNDMIEAGVSYDILIGEVSLHLKPYYRHMTEAAESWDEPRFLAEIGYDKFMLSTGGVAELHQNSTDVKLWPWGSIKFNSYPWDITLSYGKFKGEYICKNGVCAYELPFEGLKADLTLYF